MNTLETAWKTQTFFIHCARLTFFPFAGIIKKESPAPVKKMPGLSKTGCKTAGFVVYLKIRAESGRTPRPAGGASKEEII